MNKRLIIIFVCVAVFVLTLVVGAVVFTISDVNILLSSNENIAFDKAKILDTSGIKKGQSVFTIDRDEASENIEKQFPELKVVKIERAFPNKVRIHLDIRTALFKMKLANSSNYAVLDRELKIINIVTDDNEIYGDNKVILINGYEYSGGENPLGDFIKDESNEINSLKEIIKSLESFEAVNQRISATFDSITFGKDIALLKTSIAITMVIRINANVSAGTQCDGLYNKYYSMSDSEREQPNYMFFDTNGTIVIDPNMPQN